LHKTSPDGTATTTIFYKKYYEDATDCATRIGSKIRNHYFLLLTFKLFPRTLLSEAAFFCRNEMNNKVLEKLARQLRVSTAL